MTPRLVSIALCCLAATATGLAGEGDLRVGFGSADVTPDIKKPVWLAGFGKNRKATKVHDPIMARAVVLDHDKQRIAFVSVDVVGLFHDVVERVRPRLPGITYLCVTSTHNHEGPDTIGMWGPNLFTTGVDPDYITQIEDGIVAAVKKGEMTLVKVQQTRLGSARDANLVHDSRLPIVKHDELTAMQFFDAANKTLGVVVTWNCHPETLDSKNTEVSADFVAPAVKYLEDKFKAPVVYLTGTVGGLMSNLGLQMKDDQGKPLANGTFEKTNRYGAEVGKLTEKALAAGRIAKMTPFRVQRRELYLPIDNNGYMLGYRLGVLKRNAFGWSGDFTKPAPVDKGDTKQRMAAKTEIARLRLGELDIAAIPGEIYPELVLGQFQEPVDPGADFPDAPLEPHIYRHLNAPFRMVIGLANDELGYIIPKRQWDEKAPFCYGRTSSQYGEINSLGPETAPFLCRAFQELVEGK
jgi:hypothetical protein